MNVYLKTDTRKEFNDLVDQLNGVIQQAIGDANRDHGKEQAHYVDVNWKFMGQRFCEAGDFHEPDENREDTWFFLSAWKDFPLLDPSVS